MLDMFVIDGTDKFVCQKCGKELLPLTLGNQQCNCGQKWKVSLCLGGPLARITLEETGQSTQPGNPYYKAGWFVKKQ